MPKTEEYPLKVKQRTSKKHGVTYMWYFYYYDASGRRTKSKSGFLSYQDAFNDGLPIYSDFTEKGIIQSKEDLNKSLNDAYEQIKKDYSEQSYSTKREDKNRYNKYFRTKYGNRFIKTFKISELQELVNMWNKTTYKTTYQHNCSLLRKLFKTARRNGWISDNPCDFLIYPKGRQNNLYKTKMPETEDIALFREYLLKRIKEYKKDKRYRSSGYEIRGHLLALEIGLLTGARIGEIYGLDWIHINFKDMVFEYRQNFDYMENKLNTSMKNKFASRDDPFNKDLKERIVEYKNETLKKYGTLPTSFLTRDDGERLNPRRMQDYMQKFNRIYKKNLSFHQLRHYFTTINMLEINADLNILQSLLGHSINSSVTHNVYTHASFKKKRELLEKYNEYIKPLLDEFRQ